MCKIIDTRIGKCSTWSLCLKLLLCRDFGVQGVIYKTPDVLHSFIA